MKLKMLAALGFILTTTTFGSGCLVVSGDQDRQCYDECYQSSCYDDCRTYEVCDVYQDPWETWEECWYETECDQVCDTTCTQVCEETWEAPQPSVVDNSCVCDLDCSANSVCVSGTCAPRKQDTQPGQAGLCQSCETSYDCGEPGAMCIRLNYDQGIQDGEKICARQCETNADCPQAFECVNVSAEAGASAQCLPVDRNNRRTCNPNPELECVRAKDCAVGESCVNNSCVGPNNAECDSHTACGAGKICRDFKCEDAQSPECVDRNDCSGTEICINGQCEAQNSSCVFNEECDGGKCVNGQCVASCTSNDQCGAYERCRQGLCEAVECRRTADCAAGQVCVDANCEDSCNTTADCGSGYICSTHKYCTPDPNVQCRTNAECARDEVCDAGQCKTPCSCNQQCPVDQVCNAGSGTCEAIQQTPGTQCQDNCDCPSGQSCSNGTCR